LIGDFGVVPNIGGAASFPICHRCSVDDFRGRTSRTGTIFRPLLPPMLPRRSAEGDPTAVGAYLPVIYGVLERAMGNRPLRRHALKSLAIFRRPVDVL
jgi:hypothetical protein